jgi:hypothetical protein
MTKPRHQRCTVCGVVTSRYSHTEAQGPFSVKVWVRDERNGSVQGADGNPYCREHAPAAKPFVFTPVPAMPPVTVDDLLRRAAVDETLDDDTFTVLSRALHGADPINGDVRS